MSLAYIIQVPIYLIELPLAFIATTVARVVMLLGVSATAASGIELAIL